jgi:homoserine dehydrogenase
VRVNVRAHASVCALSGLGVLVLTRLVDCRYTEPDPRDDLSGSDVARKALIMARTLGWEFEMDQIEVESLFSTDMAELSVADFKQAIGKLDGEMSAKRDAADADGKVLRYVASCSKDGLKVGLQAVPKDSPLGLLSGPDNMMVVSSALYADRPLVVQGAGAGDDVTAAGVVADCVDLARSARIAGTSV